jgi:hypothetical protein
MFFKLLKIAFPLIVAVMIFKVVITFLKVWLFLMAAYFIIRALCSN